MPVTAPASPPSGVTISHNASKAPSTTGVGKEYKPGRQSQSHGKSTGMHTARGPSVHSGCENCMQVCAEVLAATVVLLQLPTEILPKLVVLTRVPETR